MIKHLWFWLIMTIVAVFILPAFISTASYQSRMRSELAMLEHTFGNKAASQILAMTDNAFSVVFEKSGFRVWVIDHYYIDDREVVKGRTEGGVSIGLAAQLSQNYSVSLFTNLYELTFRLTQMFIWFACALPFVIAASFDGVMNRKVRAVSFAYSSPSVYNATWHFIIVLVFFGMFYFNTPYPVPPIFFPLAVGIMALALRTLISNLQRSA